MQLKTTYLIHTAGEEVDLAIRVIIVGEVRNRKGEKKNRCKKSIASQSIINTTTSTIISFIGEESNNVSARLL